MAQSSESLFLTAIRQSLHSCPSLGLAIANGMGGCDANDKLIWMGPVIDNFFSQNNGLSPDEVCDFVTQILNNEFDTIIEDGSIELLSVLLCRYYKLWTEKNYDELTQILEKRKSMECSNVSNVKQSSHDTSVPIQQMQSLSVEDESMSTENKNDLTQLSEDNDGEWTLVRSKHRR